MPTKTSTDFLAQALDKLESEWDRYVDQLKDLVRIPSISAEKPPTTHLHRCADAVTQLLVEAGLENCRLMEMPSAHPYVYGEWLGALGAATILIYGHYDVQPPGRPDH